MWGPTDECGPVAQLGARLNGIQEVTGSIPVRSTIPTFRGFGWLNPTFVGFVRLQSSGLRLFPRR
jgi:hypothetical protein